MESGNYVITEEEKKIAEELGLVDPEAVKKKLKGTVKKHVSSNQEVREELAERVSELTEKQPNKGESK